MRKQITKLGFISSALALAIISGSTVFALPPHANVHAESATGAPAATDTSNTNTTGTGSYGPGMNRPAGDQGRLTTGKLKACQNRENAIKNIMSRIDTRAQNQITLFGTIATRVENFYTNKGKTVSNYDQLTAAIATAKSQAETDLSKLQSSSTFSCDGSDPKGMVTSFQGYLKTEITDLQNYRTAVKNLIVAVAKANGETVSSSTSSNSNQSTTAGGQ